MVKICDAVSPTSRGLFNVPPSPLRFAVINSWSSGVLESLFSGVDPGMSLDLA